MLQQKIVNVEPRANNYIDVSALHVEKRLKTSQSLALRVNCHHIKMVNWVWFLNYCSCFLRFVWNVFSSMGKNFLLDSRLIWFWISEENAKRFVTPSSLMNVKQLDVSMQEKWWGYWYVLQSNSSCQLYTLKHISNLFAMMLSHGFTPENIIRAVITAILKKCYRKCRL